MQIVIKQSICAQWYSVQMVLCVKIRDRARISVCVLQATQAKIVRPWSTPVRVHHVQMVARVYQAWTITHVIVHPVMLDRIVCSPLAFVIHSRVSMVAFVNHWLYPTIFSVFVRQASCTLRMNLKISIIPNAKLFQATLAHCVTYKSMSVHQVHAKMELLACRQ